MARLITAFISLGIVFQAATVLPQQESYPVDTPLEGVQSPYSAQLIKLVKNWKSQQSTARDDGPLIAVTCFETLGNPYYIGMLQEQKIHADFDAVVKVLDNMNNYQSLFFDFKDIHVMSHDRNKSVSYWEQKSPVFFVANIKYEMIYLVNQVSTKLKIYRYQLKEAGKLKADDGVIFVEKITPRLTSLKEYDFWDADWGILKSTMPRKIWPENIKGNLLSNLSIQFKAEHPDWDYKRIHKEAEKSLDSIKWKEAIANKVKFQIPEAQNHAK